MKKYIFALPIFILPYIVLGAIYCTYTGFLMDSVFHSHGLILLFWVNIIYFIGFIYSVIYAFTGLFKKDKSLEMIKMNMIIKLVHIPAYIIIFLLGLLLLITIFTMAASFYFIFVDGLTIFCSGLIGFVAILKGTKENKVDKQKFIKYSILQFVYCFDIFYAVHVFRQSKKISNESILKKKILFE